VNIRANTGNLNEISSSYQAGRYAPLLAYESLDRVSIYGIFAVVVTPPPWDIEFYESDDDGCPVQDFLDGLDKPRRAKVVALIEHLREQGPTLPFPYSSQVRGKIRELRTQYGKERYRVMYFGGPKRTFVLLHALKKSTKKLPEGDIKIAEERMKRYLEENEDD